MLGNWRFLFKGARDWRDIVPLCAALAMVGDVRLLSFDGEPDGGGGGKQREAEVGRRGSLFWSRFFVCCFWTLERFVELSSSGRSQIISSFLCLGDDGY